MEPTLPLVNARCCGIDVHKETVVVCVRTAAPGGRPANDVRTFGTTTRALLEQGDWLTKRRGPKRATLAVAHAQLCTIHAMLKNGTAYADLGGDPFDRRDGERLKGQLVNRLQRLGFRVTIEPAAAA